MRRYTAKSRLRQPTILGECNFKMPTFREGPFYEDVTHHVAMP
jgi:hypothetical protein